MKFIETHAHIYASQFDKDRDDAVERARELGVEEILMPNIDEQSIDGMLEAELRYGGVCKAMMGLHPCYVKKDFERILYLVEDWWSKRDFIAMGEMGIDLYWDKTHIEQQKEAFRIQTRWAMERKKPIVIHARDANEVVIELLEELQDGTLTGVLHCFSGSVEEAQKFIELGMYLGIGGVATYKKGGLDLVLPEIALSKLLLETDCPYLAPVPHRGKRNEPAYVEIVSKRIANIKEITQKEVADATTKNARCLFQM